MTHEDPTFEDVVYLITILVKTVNPKIDEEIAYDLLTDLFEREWNSEMTVIECGTLIAKTGGAPRSRLVQ